MTQEEITDYVDIYHGDLTIISDKWSHMFNRYIDMKKSDIEKIYNAVTAEYDPLDNNDVTTETTVLNKNDITETQSPESKVNEYNKSYDGGLEKTSYTDNENITNGKLTPHNTLSETFQNTDNTGYNSTSKTLERKHGNISSITNQSIITQEIKLRMIDWLSDIIDRAVYYGGVYYAN